MHTDQQIKDWVCTNIHQLVAEYRTDVNEHAFKAAIQITDKEGIQHDYTVFLELSSLDGDENWVVRNIVRPEQLQ